MTIAIDLDTHLASNLAAIAQQAIGNTQSFAHYANLAFTKDLDGRDSADRIRDRPDRLHHFGQPQ